MPQALPPPDSPPALPLRTPGSAGREPGLSCPIWGYKRGEGVPYITASRWPRATDLSSDHRSTSTLGHFPFSWQVFVPEIYYTNTRWLFHIFYCGNCVLPKTHCFNYWWACSSRTSTMCTLLRDRHCRPDTLSPLNPHSPSAPPPLVPPAHRPPLGTWLLQGPPVRWARAGSVLWGPIPQRTASPRLTAAQQVSEVPSFPSRAGRYSRHGPSPSRLSRRLLVDAGMGSTSWLL